MPRRSREEVDGLSHRDEYEGVLSIRKADIADFSSVSQLMVAFHAESGMRLQRRRSLAALAQLLESPMLGVAYVAAKDSTIVAYLLLTLGFSIEYYGRDAFIDELYVSNAHRRRGIATRLVCRAIRDCQALRVKAVHLEVERSNNTARELYRTFGFDDHDRLLMTRLVR